MPGSVYTPDNAAPPHTSPTSDLVRQPHATQLGQVSVYDTLPPAASAPGPIAEGQAAGQATSSPHVHLTDRHLLTCRGDEVCGSEICAHDLLYKLLVKQSAEDYLPSTDTASEPTPDVTYDTPVNQQTADISTVHGTSDAQSPEINSDELNDHVDMQSTEVQHELHGSAGQPQITANNGTESVAVFPTISPSNYDSDEEFANMYMYLKYDTLTGNACLDKTTLIMAERYLIDKEGLLF